MFDIEPLPQAHAFRQLDNDHDTGISAMSRVIFTGFFTRTRLRILVGGCKTDENEIPNPGHQIEQIRVSPLSVSCSCLISRSVNVPHRFGGANTWGSLSVVTSSAEK